MCNREEYYDDGFNEITETKSEKMLKAKMLLKLSSQRKFKITFLHHITLNKCINRTIDQNVPNIKNFTLINVNSSQIIVKISQIIGPSNSTTPFQ